MLTRAIIYFVKYIIAPNNVHESVLDPDWIKKYGENNWIVVPGDKRIETVPENRQAVIEAKAKAFLLNDSNSKPEVWAAAILLGQYKNAGHNRCDHRTIPCDSRHTMRFAHSTPTPPNQMRCRRYALCGKRLCCPTSGICLCNSRGRSRQISSGRDQRITCQTWVAV